MRRALARARRAVAGALEGGEPGRAPRDAAFSWLAGRGSPLVLPAGTLAIAIRGATLGGSWKTPTALALAAALADRGETVGFAARSYGGSLRQARTVSPTDDVRAVGDEALIAARSLPRGVAVVAGPRRADVVRLLAGRADVLVLDGHQRRAGPGQAIVLTLDAERPFGAGATPPRGDLRAPPDALVREARWVLAVRDALAADGPALPYVARVATYELGLPEWAAGARVALVTAVARPGRIADALARRGVRVVGHVALADHGGGWASAAAERGLSRLAGFDVVVTTEKCATWLPPRLGGRPVIALTLRLTLPPSLVDDVVASARALRRARAGLLVSPDALR